MNTDNKEQLYFPHLKNIVPPLLDLIFSYGTSHENTFKKERLPHFFIQIGINILSNILISIYESSELNHKEILPEIITGLNNHVDNYLKQKQEKSIH